MIFIFEINRGENSKQWHVHVHFIWNGETAPVESEIAEEWHDLTGATFVKSKEIEAVKDDTLDEAVERVVGYCLKPSSLSIPDAYHSHTATKGKRFIRRWGAATKAVADELDKCDIESDEVISETAFSFDMCDGKFKNVPVTKTPEPELETEEQRVQKAKRTEENNWAFDEIAKRQRECLQAIRFENAAKIIVAKKGRLKEYLNPRGAKVRIPRTRQRSRLNVANVGGPAL